MKRRRRTARKPASRRSRHKVAKVESNQGPPALLRRRGFSRDCASARIVPIVLQPRLCFQKSGLVTSFGP
jgi:hypothetical protein